MTGYGKAEATVGDKKICVEIRSLNSKSMDLSTRIAPLFREQEMVLRQTVAKKLERGKVDFTLRVDKADTAAAGHICPEAVAGYVSQIQAISDAQDLPLPENVWELVLRLPDVMGSEEAEELTPEVWEAAQKAVDEALAHLTDFRRQEGAALEKKFREKVDNIEQLLAEIEPYEKSRVEKIRQRLEDRLAELKGVDYDKGRLEQELIYYIEKLDISEEKQRLTNHLRYFRETLDNGHGQGKKLGFIAQEMGREINTTGSKSNQAEMQNIVVKMKDELEQIKEQVLNVM